MTVRLFPAGAPAFPPLRTRAFLLQAALCCTSFATLSCGDTTQVRWAPPAERIVSLVPSATDVLLELGAAARMAGRTDYDRDARIADVTSFGRTMSASSEAILAQHPDLVIDASYAPWRVPAGLSEHAQVATLTTDLQTFADILALIDTIGVLVGEEQRAAALRARLERDAASMRAAAASIRPAVLYLVWADPPRTISSTSYLSEVIELAGARNAFPELELAWPEISMEVILQRDPDFIIVASESPGIAEDLRTMPVWMRLSAVKAGRVIEAPNDLFHRPGPRMITAARWLRDALRKAQDPKGDA